MKRKRKIIKALNEVSDSSKHLEMTADKYSEIGDTLGDDAVVRIVDESDGENLSARVNNVINGLKANNIDVTVDNIVVGSLFSPGGTLSGMERDIMRVLDANNANNTYDDYERDSRDVEYGINPHMREGVDNESESDVKSIEKLRGDVQKFMDKINLSQFDNLLKKIDKPIEQAELIAAFSERIGVPRAKLPMIIKSLKEIGVTNENVRARMKKSELVEHILKNK